MIMCVYVWPENHLKSVPQEPFTRLIGRAGKQAGRPERWTSLCLLSYRVTDVCYHILPLYMGLELSSHHAVQQAFY